LNGKIAIVTGGGRGIGAAIARRLASMGANTIICGRTLAVLEETARSIIAAGGQCETLPCDVTDFHSVEALAARVGKNFQHTDILVNNAGVGSFSTPLHQLPPEEWEKIMNTNLRGVYYSIRAFAPMMIRAGSGDIVNISSIAGKNALANGAAYSASKWGLNG